MPSAGPSLTQSGEPNGFGRSRSKFSCYFAQRAVCLPPTTRLLGEGRNPRIQPPQTHTLMTSEGLMAFGQSLLIGRLRMKRAVPRSARPSLLNHAWSYVKIRWNITGEVPLLPIGCDLPGHRCDGRFTELVWGCFKDAHTAEKCRAVDLPRSGWHECRGNHEIPLDPCSTSCLLNYQTRVDTCLTFLTLDPETSITVT
jgi:hypothetical protein